jgi:riboflavin synthase
MFTGLIQAIGTLRSLENNQVQITCDTAGLAQLQPDLELGDSIAVDGICLTVTHILPTGFIATVSPETLSRTTLAGRTGENSVNLEPSLKVGSKLGGHFVTGHIDGTGYLEMSERTESAWEMSFQVPDSRVSRYIVPKGSIAVNGVSLTVADCNPDGTWFKVAVIPLTYAETNLQYLQPGSPVNLEGDVLGKYVEKFLRLSPNSSAVTELGESITPGFLVEHGYS